MTSSTQGNPCWYELATGKDQLDAAGAFYAGVLGWSVEDSGMQGSDYHLARSGGDMVAGLMVMPEDVADVPPFWMTYFAVDDADRFVQDATSAGASIHREPTDIPETGRFALLADPQGAAFGILQPDMSNMSEAKITQARSGSDSGAFAPGKPGRANWNELMSTDPVAGFAFYSKLLGWTRGETIDMGETGTYQLFRSNDIDIGGMMGLGDAPRSNWLPYFGVQRGVEDAIEAIKSEGGSVHAGPMEVPGGSYIAVAQDPQGAWFAVVGAAR